MKTLSRKQETKLIGALVAVASRGDTKRCLSLISEGAPIDGVGKHGYAKRRTALRAAIERGREQTALELLKHGADPNWIVPVNDYFDPLHSLLMLASRAGQISVVKALIKAGAKVNYSRRGGETALTQA